MPSGVLGWGVHGLRRPLNECHAGLNTTFLGLASRTNLVHDMAFDHSGTRNSVSAMFNAGLQRQFKPEVWATNPSSCATEALTCRR
jgi:hypothetical protein